MTAKNVFVLMLSLAVARAASAETNRYAAISKRNSFALRSQFPAMIAPQPAAPSPLKIKLAGLAAVSTNKWAVLQIQERGKPEVTLALKEGAAKGPVEILEVDVTKQSVRIRVAGSEMRIAFEDEVASRKKALAELEAAHPPLPVTAASDAGYL